MYLSPSQLAALAQDIKQMHLGYAVQVFGMDATGVTPEVYHQLVAGGYVTSQQVTDWAMSAYKLGQVQGWSQIKGIYDAPTVPSHRIDSLYLAAKQDGLPEPSAAQKSAVDFIRQKAASKIIGLGNRVADDFTTIAIESESEVRKELKGKIAEDVAESTIRRETAKKLASRLGNSTQDWARNMQRIAETELEDAHQNGLVDTWEEPLKTGGFRMAKRPSPGACDHCKRLYLDEDGNPRIFTEAELRGNGTNFKVKAKDWKAVIGPTHPHCHCILILVPPGFGFDAEGRMVPIAKKEAA